MPVETRSAQIVPSHPPQGSHYSSIVGFSSKFSAELPMRHFVVQIPRREVHILAVTRPVGGSSSAGMVNLGQGLLLNTKKLQNTFQCRV